MNGDVLLQLALLAVAVGLFASDRVRPDAVALGLILALTLTRQLAPAEAVAGFGDPLVLMIAGLFIVGEGLASTGVAQALGGVLVRRAGASEVKLLAGMMIMVAVLSAFMSSTGAVAVFIPVSLTLARRTGISGARLLLPVASASLLGGMLTLIGTPPNLVVSEELERQGLSPFGFFDFLPIGLAVLLLGIAYFVLIGRHQFGQSGAASPATQDPSLRDLVEHYGKIGQSRALQVTADSQVRGRSLAELALREHYGLTLIGLDRRHALGREAVAASADLRLREGDTLHVLGTDEAASAFAATQRLRPVGRFRHHQVTMLREIGLAEVLIPPGSSLVGTCARQAQLRSRRGLTVLAVARRGETLDGDPGEIEFAAGDTVLVLSGWREIRELPRPSRELLALTIPRELEDFAPTRLQAPQALGIVLAMLLVMTFKVLPGVSAVLLAALAMVALRCVPASRVYGCINWPSLVLIAGMLPMATALERSGALTMVVGGLVDLLGGLGPVAMMAGLFLLTAVFSQFISNTATSVLVAPMAALAAEQLGVSPRPFLMVVALAASAAFLTPVASPVNTLVMGPGGYGFRDFLRAGTPLFLITMVVALLLVPLVFPL